MVIAIAELRERGVPQLTHISIHRPHLFIVYPYYFLIYKYNFHVVKGPHYLYCI